MIDLAAAYATVEAMLAGYGITNAHYNVGVSVWHYASGAGQRVEFSAAAVIDKQAYGGYARPTLDDAMAALDRELADYVSRKAPVEPITDLRVTLPGEPEPVAVGTVSDPDNDVPF